MSADPPAGSVTTLDVDGVATRMLVLDGDGPTVVLLHGSGPGVTAWANWRLTAPALAEAGFRVVAPDLLGFGGTGTPPDDAYRLEAWVGHLRGTLDAAGVEVAHVVGNSFGGALALHLAVTDPGRVDRLVLMGSVGTPFPITGGWTPCGGTSRRARRCDSWSGRSRTTRRS